MGISTTSVKPPLAAVEAAKAVSDLMREVYDIKSADNHELLFGRIASISNDGTRYDVYLEPDEDTALRDVPNMTPFLLNEGDYCYVCQVPGKGSEYFICYARGQGVADRNAWVQTLIDAAIAPLRVEINNVAKTATLPDAHGCYF